MKSVNRLCLFVFPGKAEVGVAVYSADMIGSRLSENEIGRSFANAAREK